MLPFYLEPQSSQSTSNAPAVTDSFFSSTENTVNSAGNSASQFFSNPFNALGNIGSDIGNGIQSGFSDALKPIENLFIGAFDIVLGLSLLIYSIKSFSNNTGITDKLTNVIEKTEPISKLGGKTKVDDTTIVEDTGDDKTKVTPKSSGLISDNVTDATKVATLIK